MVRTVVLTILLALLSTAAAAEAAPTPAVAFYYGSEPPWDELHAFDWVVVEPGHVPDAQLAKQQSSELFAYVSVGEVDRDRAYLKKIPDAWRLGINRAWNSIVIDQAQPQWPAFYVDNVIAPLWQRGFRAFFLDTLDSYQLFADSDAKRTAQEDGMVAVIRLIKQRYPEARLILNRGFEILPQVHELVNAVAAESLYAGWDPVHGTYAPVGKDEHDWLQEKLIEVRHDYRLPAIVIDYLPPGQRSKAREVAAKIRADGFIPWVTDHDLNMLGVGELEVMPRRILMLYDSADNATELMLKEKVLLHAATPANYLGYAPDYVDPRQELPEGILTGRYAGIIVWLDKPLSSTNNRRLSQWLGRQAENGVPLLFLDGIEFLTVQQVRDQFGIHRDETTGKPVQRVSIVQQDSMFGYEMKPRPDRNAFFPLRVDRAQPLLTLKDDQGRTQMAAAITPWGGYVLDPFTVVTLPAGQGDRWMVDPFALMTQALRLPPLPVPDTTTENGRRLLLIHMDGDGFASRAEFPGSPLAAEVLRDKILKKYPLPATISVIEGETGPDGLYPKLSPEMESVARDIFALPNVEIGSHTFSHPFNWGIVGTDEDDGGEDYNLKIPGYRFNLTREIEGSIHYIESRLAPPGKKVVLLQWSGDCNPTAEELAHTYRAGVLNINGGDTVMTKSLPTLTAVAPLGVPKGDDYQVFAPNQNENVYTNDWQGPYYGYRRIIETFQMTDSPRRLKPINIYYHTYAASKLASLEALDEVYRWAIAQHPTPVFTSEYVRKVLDFRHVVVARGAGRWRIRGLHDLRELRMPQALGRPDVDTSEGVAGYNAHESDYYIHAAASDVELRLSDRAPRLPYVVSSNGEITGYTRDQNGTHFTLRAYAPLELELANASRCTVQANGHTFAPRQRRGTTATYAIADHVAEPIEALCRP